MSDPCAADQAEVLRAHAISAPLPRWLPGVPWVSLVVVASTAAFFLAQVTPLLDRVAPSLAPALGVAANAKVLSAALFWCGAMAATVLALLAALSACVFTIRTCERESPAGTGGSWSAPVQWMLIGVTALAALGLQLAYGRTQALDLADSQGDQLYLRLPVNSITDVVNILAAASIASLFGASSVLMRSASHAVSTISDPCARASRLSTLAYRLQWVLMLGTAAMVLGVLQLAGILRLPAAAIEAMATTPDLVADAAGLRDVASHMATYWGTIFTVGLIFMYVPASLVIAGGMASVRATESSAGASSVSFAERTRGVLGPLARAAALLAPLLAGQMSDLFLRASSAG